MVCATAERTTLPAAPRPEAICRFALLLLVLAVAGGCASSRYATLREVPSNPLADQLKLFSRKGPQTSPRTQQFVRVHDLEPLQKEGNPRKLLERVQQIIEQEPSADKVYAFAELSFLEAKKAEKYDTDLALDLYGAAVLHAYQYLFDPRFAPTRNPYDPEFRGACDLYNTSLEGALRLVCRDGGLLPGRSYAIRTATGVWNVTCSFRNGPWCSDEIEKFEFVSDYEIRGLKNHYQTYGLGVPLIAVRKPYEGEPPAARYYPENLSFPVTVFFRPQLGASPYRANRHAQQVAHLELYDPLIDTDIEVDGLCVPLQSDLTTPLAYFLSDPRMASLATVGLLRPEKLLAFRPGGSKPIMGLYMVQPYEPEKIPVVMVHGLWSSPMTWMEMFNDLRSSPEIRKHYQFWFYLYPTAQPFWISAAQLRKDLAEVREVLDPYHSRPALDQMVLVGHSMGGLLSRLQTIESGNSFWQQVSDQPFHLVRAEPEIRERIADSLFFRPNPSVQRVITIGTPHRGSRFSNRTTQWLLEKLIRLPEVVLNVQERFYRENQQLIRDERLLRIDTSVESLDPDCPFFQVMLASQRAPWVKYHNIVGMVPREGIMKYLIAEGDGVVGYPSAHMDDVQSEVIVPADHGSVHAHPRAVREVRRILLEHLAEMRGFPTFGDRVRTARHEGGIPAGGWPEPLFQPTEPAAWTLRGSPWPFDSLPPVPASPASAMPPTALLPAQPVPLPPLASGLY